MKETENELKDASLFEISDLIAEYLSGELSPRQQERLDEWLNEDESHQTLFDSICSKATIHAKYDTYREDNSDSAFLKFAVRRRFHKFRYTIRIVGAVAAVLALMFGGWLFYQTPEDTTQTALLQTKIVPETKVAQANKPLLKMYTGEELVIDSSGYVAEHIDENNLTQFDNQTESDSKPAIKFNEMVVPSMCDFYFTMNDGTKVWMNANSSVRYPVTFANNERTIYVSGEVYLEVARDVNRPFFVEVEGMRIAVLGTSFNVRSYADEDEVSVTLVEGKVKATIQSKNYNLTPGKQLLLASDANGVADVSIANIDVNDVTAWMKGYYVFKKSRLSEVAATLRNWYGIDIEFNTSKSRAIEYTGVINKNEPIEVFISRLREVSSVRSVRKDDKLYIY